MDTVKVGKYLSQLRRQNGFTQEELGEKLGVTNKTISRWENGHYMPPVDIFERLSQLYGVSINEMLNGTPSEPRRHKRASGQSAAHKKSVLGFFRRKRKKRYALSLTVGMLLILTMMVVKFICYSDLQLMAA